MKIEMITGVAYRTKAIDIKPDIEKNNYNDSSLPQFEIAVFSDGTVAQRWMTNNGSTSIWNCLEDLYNVHVYPHPDYGTVIYWSNGLIEKI